MTISLFVYYNVLVHISKTTKDTTSAQENFFVYVFFPIEWWKNRPLACGLFFYSFLLMDTSRQNAAQG